MKTRNKMILAALAIVFGGLLIFAANRHKKTNRMLTKIADEGYETASDVLFPDKQKRNSKLRYGPVLPA